MTDKLATTAREAVVSGQAHTAIAQRAVHRRPQRDPDRRRGGRLRRRRARLRAVRSRDFVANRSRRGLAVLGEALQGRRGGGPTPRRPRQPARGRLERLGLPRTAPRAPAALSSSPARSSTPRCLTTATATGSWPAIALRTPRRARQDVETGGGGVAERGERSSARNDFVACSMRSQLDRSALGVVVDWRRRSASEASRLAKPSRHPHACRLLGAAELDQRRCPSTGRSVALAQRYETGRVDPLDAASTVPCSSQLSSSRPGAQVDLGPESGTSKCSASVISAQTRSIGRRSRLRVLCIARWCMKQMVNHASLGTMPRSTDRERTVLTHRVTFIPGDGTGPELAEATRRVLEATGVEFEWDFQDAGIDVYEQEGIRCPTARSTRSASAASPSRDPRPPRSARATARSTWRCARSSTSTAASAPARPTRACARASPRPTS